MWAHRTTMQSVAEALLPITYGAVIDKFWKYRVPKNNESTVPCSMKALKKYVVKHSRRCIFAKMEAKYRAVIKPNGEFIATTIYKAFTLEEQQFYIAFTNRLGRVPVKVKSNVDKRRPGEQEAHLDIKYSRTEVKGFDTKGL